MSAQGHHFVWWDLLHSDFLKENSHIGAAATTIITLLAAGVFYALAAPRLTAATKDDKQFVPDRTFSIRNIFELLGEFIQEIAKDIIGHHYEKYLPIILFIFIWTLTSNLLGLLPGFGSATDNINTTIGMGLVVFLYYNYQGFRSHGFKYLEHFTGHLGGVLLIFLGPVMFVIETISHFVRPVTLGMRLRSNISGDHELYGSILNVCQELGKGLQGKMGGLGDLFAHMIAGFGPVPIVILGAMVCIIQAFVFTLLTTVYVGMATAHDDH